MKFLTIKSKTPFHVQVNLNDPNDTAEVMTEIEIMPNNISGMFDFRKNEKGLKLQGTVIVLNQMKIAFVDVIDDNAMKFNTRSCTIKRAIEFGLDTVELD